MSQKNHQENTKWIVQRKDFQSLFDILIQKGYNTYAPTLRDNAVAIDEVSSVDDLPIGWLDKQDGGTYRLIKNDKPTLFGYVCGPESWKKELYPPEKKMFEVHRDSRSFKVQKQDDEPPKKAFIGVRACELNALAIHDKILMQGEYIDLDYKRRRENSIIIAVNCTRAGGTCFCVSMNTGPKATSGFDLSLTEVFENDRHFFLVETGSEIGNEILNDLPKNKATEAEIETAENAIRNAASQMGRTLDTDGIDKLLYDNLEHPRWNEVSSRCLSCGNCTMVCPTCFCITVEDYTDLTGQQAQRQRKWDSCFTVDFSYIYGGSIRTSARSRYRQWMTHKLAGWVEQFGRLGCVGCGRCITWCPVGIDITEEARIIRESKRKV